MLEVKVLGLGLRKGTIPQVIIGNLEAGRVIVATINEFEFRSLIATLQKIPMPVPVIYNVFQKAVEALKGKIEKVVLTRPRITNQKMHVSADVYLISPDGISYTLDSRMIDGLILAYLSQSPIFIADDALQHMVEITAEEHMLIDHIQQEHTPTDTSPDVKSWLDTLKPEDFKP